jgi:tRNA uridine 5-carboxymethylaminomethyl modification enzyme
MFTSRAEYRILLRQDNADERLTRIGRKLGTVNKERLKKLDEKIKMVEEIIKFLEAKSIEPSLINEYLESKGTSKIEQKVKAITLASRPQIGLKELIENIDNENLLEAKRSSRFAESAESAEIRIKYEGYIKREKIIAEKINRLEGLAIPKDIIYNELMSISTEGRQKLERFLPENIGQAKRISGVSPSDINILLMYLGR